MNIFEILRINRKNLSEIKENYPNDPVIDFENMNNDEMRDYIDWATAPGDSIKYAENPEL